MPEMNSPKRERQDFLRASPLFADLHSEEIALLSELCQEVHFAAGDIIFSEGDLGETLYIVEQGTVEIVHASEGQERVVIAQLQRGAFFGEMSLLERRARSASAVASSPVELLALAGEDFHSFARIYRNGFTVVIINIARVLSQRLRQTTARLSEGS